MFDLTLKLEVAHPLTTFTRRHPSTRAILFLEEVQGRSFEHQVVVASPALQAEYRRAHEEAGSCSPLTVAQEMPDFTSYYGGPCSCQGAQAACAGLHGLRSRLQAEFPGRLRLSEIVFERGRSVGRAVYFERALPVSEEAAANAPWVLEAASRVLLPDSKPDFLSRRLSPTEVDTLRVAIRLGYYASPRRSTMDDLAGALGITKSAVCHRLNKLEQKAMRELLRNEPRAGGLTPAFNMSQTR